MRKKVLSAFSAVLIAVTLCSSAVYAEETPGYLPPDISELDTLYAVPWLQVSQERVGMEGPVFDDEGNLFVCDTGMATTENNILKIDSEKSITTIWSGNESPVGLAFGPDGRLYATCLGGKLLAMSPDGSDVEEIIPEYEGQTFVLNDLVFADNGNLYVTDWKGNVNDPIGGVYMLTAESGYTEATPVAAELAGPNGISFTPDRTGLWISLANENSIYKISLGEDGLMAPMLGLCPVYFSMGLEHPDSNKTDSEGNLYQAMQLGGRALVFNSDGMPVMNIVIPERAEGRLKMTSNLVIKPGTTEGYLLTAGMGDGSWIYTFEALAPAMN